MGHFQNFWGKNFFMKGASPKIFLESLYLWLIITKNESWWNFLFQKKIWGGKISKYCIFWIFQNFITFLKIHFKNWNFAHILVCLKTTTTPKIKRFCQKLWELFWFLCFLSFGYHSRKNRRKISNKKRNSCKCVSLMYILRDFFLM